MYSEKEFLQAISEHKQIILKVCNLYADTVVARQDLFQEIMLNAWYGIRNFKGDAKFSTWLYRVSLNTAMTYLKKDKKYRSVIDRSATVEDRPDPPGEPNVHMQAMERSIQELSHVDKALVTLYLDHLDYQQIGEIMGISANHVAVKMNRIRTKLRETGKKFKQNI